MTEADDINISVIGMGYVGLASGLGYTSHGYRTTITDIISSRVENLKKGIMPFFEPHLQGLVNKEVESGMLRASTNNIETIRESNVTFICVGTPSLHDGSADLKFVREVAKDIGIAIRDKREYHVVVVKSTVLPCTTESIVLPVVEEFSGKKAGDEFGIIMNPEFLRQGQAVHDSLHPDRIIIGQMDDRAGEMVHRIYEGYTDEKGDPVPILHVEIKAAELIKYAANSLLATKISFANEFARICEKFNIDVYDVMKGVGLDSRINPLFLNAGCGFGGSCFPKDVNAIVSMAEAIEVETPIMEAVLHTNDIQPMHFVSIIEDVVGDLEGKVVAFLGLSFKPDTDDVRETRALPIIQKLYLEGARIRAYDPQASDRFRSLTDLPITYTDSIEEALDGADFAVIQSDWNDFRNIEPATFKRLLREPVVIDGRRTYDPKEMKSAGITYRAIGWKNTW